MDRILNACTRKTLAETALYSYNRGQEITGPSIRLAEVLAQAWGNMQFGVRELDQTEGVSTVEAYCWDLETNCKDSKVFQVPHIRHTKAGDKKLTDPRDIYEAVANVGARRKRACILAVIPGDVVESAVAQCDVTMAANADTGPDAVKRLLEAFAEYGVTRDQIEARLTNRVDAIRPAQMVSLRKIFSSLRDGISTASDWFASNGAKETLDAMKEKARQVVPVAAETVHEEAQDAQDSADWPRQYQGRWYDSRGVVHDPAVHSGGRTCNRDGTWRRANGTDPEKVAAAEKRYPRIDPLTAFGSGPAIDSGPPPILSAKDGVPGFANVLGWIADAESMDDLDLAVDASKDVDLTDEHRAEIQSAAAAQASVIEANERG